MDYLIGFLVLIGMGFLYINRDYLKYLFQEHIREDYSQDNPPFCFECNYHVSCADCKAYKLWKDGKKKEAEIQFIKDELLK